MTECKAMSEPAARKAAQLRQSNISKVTANAQSIIRFSKQDTSEKIHDPGTTNEGSKQEDHKMVSITTSNYRQTIIGLKQQEKALEQPLVRKEKTGKLTSKYTSRKCHGHSTSIQPYQ
jgi:hypothetical protein